MKDIRHAIYALLFNDPAVNALCGGRIYPAQLKQGVTEPSIVYHRITGLFYYQMDTRPGLAQNLIQIDSIARGNDSATQLANAVYDVLSGYRGDVAVGTSSPQETITVHGIFMQSDRDTFDNVTQLFVVQRDFQVWFGA